LYGPIAGGTRITIIGQFLSASTVKAVYIGQYKVIPNINRLSFSLIWTIFGMVLHLRLMIVYFFEIFSPCGSLAILVFPTKRGGAIPTGTPKRGRRMQGGMKKLTIFDQYLAVSHKRLQVGKCSETIYKHQILFPSIQHLA